MPLKCPSVEPCTRSLGRSPQTALPLRKKTICPLLGVPPIFMSDATSCVLYSTCVGAVACSISDGEEDVDAPAIRCVLRMVMRRRRSFCKLPNISSNPAVEDCDVKATSVGADDKDALDATERAELLCIVAMSEAGSDDSCDAINASATVSVSVVMPSNGTSPRENDHAETPWGRDS